MKRLFLIGLAALLLPAAARAMTIQDVMDLARSGVGDEVIVSQIDASDQVFTLTVQDILDLKKAGVSDRVITYMINTGKGTGQPAAGTSEQPAAESGTGVDRYHTSVDTYYRDLDDSGWNVYLSWGFGRYYDPWYWDYWPSYRWYYYPSIWYRPYWNYTPYYPIWHERHRDRWDWDRRIKDGRHVWDRGARQAPAYRRGNEPGRNYRAPDAGPTREIKRRQLNNPGGSGPPTTPSPQPGRTMKKQPVYGGRGEGRQAPAPALGGGARSGQGNPPPTSSSGQGSAPPPASSSGRTMKKH